MLTENTESLVLSSGTKKLNNPRQKKKTKQNYTHNGGPAGKLAKLYHDKNRPRYVGFTTNH